MIGYLFGILIGIGAFFVLLILIPSVRCWFKEKKERRITAAIAYGLVAFIFLLFFGPYVQSVYLCNYVVYYDTFSTEENFASHESQFNDVKRPFSKTRYDKWENCTESHAVELGFSNEKQMKDSVFQEYFQRSISPPFMQVDCYSDNLAFCELLDSSSSSSTRTSSNYVSNMILIFLLATVPSWLIWWWTRPKV